VLATLRQRDFALLWSAALISLTGESALVIALPLHIYTRTDSTLATSAAFAANMIPGIFFGSIAGVFVDRWDRKRTMVWSDVSRAVILLSMLFAFVTDSLPLLYLIAATQGTIGLFFGPAEDALLPRLVGEDRLVTANALNSLNNSLAMLLGPALGAFLFAWAGLGGAAFVTVVAYGGSAVLIRMIAADTRPLRSASDELAVIGTAWGRMVTEWVAGLRVICGERALKVVMVAGFLGFIADGVFVTLGLAPFVLDVLGGTEAQVGWLASAQGIAGIVAGVIVARIGHRVSRRVLFGRGQTLLGLSDFSMFFLVRRLVDPGNVAVGLAMGCMFVAGAPAVATGTGRQSIIQAHTADAFRGRIFGAFRATNGIAIVIGFAVGGVLGDRVGLVPVLATSALVGSVGGVLALMLLPRTESAHVRR
jgi:MFS family permease